MVLEDSQLDLLGLIIPIKKSLAPEMTMRPTQKEAELRAREPASLEHLVPALPTAHNPQASSYMSQHFFFKFLDFTLLC